MSLSVERSKNKSESGNDKLLDIIAREINLPDNAFGDYLSMLLVESKTGDCLVQKDPRYYNRARSDE